MKSTSKQFTLATPVPSWDNPFEMAVRRILPMILLLVSGCAEPTLLSPKPPEVERIERGMNRNQVLNALGLPNQVEKRVTKEGGTAWTWLYLRGGAATAVSVPGVQPSLNKDIGHLLARIVWSADGVVEEVEVGGEKP